MTLHDDGTDDPPKIMGDTEFDDGDDAQCQELNCQYEGKWGDFDETGNGREFTVVGGCDNADAQFQPWMRQVKARSPRRAAIMGAKLRAKEINVDVEECLVMEVVAGHHAGLLGNWGPVDVKALRERKHQG
jgi:hypothetical protein